MSGSGPGSLLRDGKSQSLPGPLFQELLTWGDQITALYKSSYAVCSILRALPVSSRHLVLRLLYYPASRSKPLSYEKIRALFRSDHVCNEARSRLLELRILEQNSGATTVAFWLNEDFAENLRMSLCDDVEVPFTMADTEMAEKEPSADELEAHAHRKWESILHFLVTMETDSGSRSAPPKAIVRALERTNLLGKSSEGLRITNHGFQFLLKDPFTQVWIVLLDLIESCTNGTIEEKVEVLLFLFELNFTIYNNGYQVAALSDTQFRLLNVLVELGLIYRSSKQSLWFYATKVGLKLVANTGNEGRVDSKNVSANLGACEIIAETNFRVYAYTTSHLQVELISMFVHMRTRLPNLAVGHITNDSVRSALQNGITADQIIGYLNAHASSRCKDSKIPSNVSQMIRLWEAEQERVRAEEAVLFNKFESEESFDEITRYAYEIGAKLWSSKEKGMLIVHARSEEAMREFARKKGVK